VEPLIFSELDENGIPNLEALKKFANHEHIPHVTDRFEL
jgi:hypothetical protein